MALGDQTPIAVVGMSCRLPGGANSPDELWEFLAKGGQAWSPVPTDRFNGAAFYHPNPDDPNGTTHHQGGHFIDADLRDFDASFFRLSAQQAAAMDPQQRFLLEMSYEALETAGWSREHVAGSSTSVYVAAFAADYERNLNRDLLDVPVYYSTGTEKAILANRLSHYFDLHGPSVTLDTACSGGLVAVHQACQGLRDGESSASIVAAASLTLSPDQHVGMSKLHLVGGSGRSYPFDDRGTGYGRGEGCVVVVLKRLADALRDRDPVMAIVRGTAVNQDGYTRQGITYPNGAAQASLIRTAYARSGLQPQDVAYVEAHGTGTAAGDAEELSALADVFRPPGSAGPLPLLVGSVKGSIGHGENTSGLASLLKAIGILNHGQVPPVAGFRRPKPGLPLDKIRIPTELSALPVVEGTIPTVSINSFGFGGTNAHAIVQGPRHLQSCAASSESLEAPGWRLFVFSAHSEVSLRMMLREYINWLDGEEDPSLADLSYTLCHRRSRLPWRFDCVAYDKSSLEEGLRRGLHHDRHFKPTASPHPYIVFVFTGQGAQWAGMGYELLHGSTASPVFQRSIRSSRDMLASFGAEWDLEEELLRQDDAETRLSTALIAQPATTALQIGLVELLRAQGVRPRAVVGHSSGEIAAAYAAGRMSHRVALGIAYHRGCVASLPQTWRGAMMAVGLGERHIRPFMEGLREPGCRVDVACVNSPDNVTVSGDAEAVDMLHQRLVAGGSGVFCRRLPVDTAYHSHHMKTVADDYLRRLDQVRDQDKGGEGQGDGKEEEERSWPNAQSGDSVVFISSVSGLHKDDGFDPGYWAANLVSQVRFVDAIQSLARYRASDGPGNDIFAIEIGPHKALSGPFHQSLADPGCPSLSVDYHSALRRKTDALWSILSLAGTLFSSGVDLKLEPVTNLCQGILTARVCTNLPRYPWDHAEKHWHESWVSRQYLRRSDPYHDLLGIRVPDSTPIEPRWRRMICLASLPWLAHHVVDGAIVFPGSGYICMVTEAMRQIYRERYPPSSSSARPPQLGTISLRDVSFSRALVVPSSPGRVEMQLSFDPQPSLLGYAFRITAFTGSGWHEYCSGLVQGDLAGTEDAITAMTTSVLSTEQLSFRGVTRNGQSLYAELAEMGNAYGTSFKGIDSFVHTSALQARSKIKIPDTAALMPARHEEQHLIHPTTLDVLLHTALPLVRQRLGNRSGSVMPTRIDELVVSVTEAGTSPGAELVALTDLVAGDPSQRNMRTSLASLYVTSGSAPMLAATGIKMQSLGASTEMSEPHTEGICYELDWKPDFDYIRDAAPSSIPSSLSDIMRQACFKFSALSVLDLGTGNHDMGLAFVDAALAQGGKLSAYDLMAQGEDQRSAQLLEKLRSQSIPFRVSTSSPIRNTVAVIAEPQRYNVVLASDANMLAVCSSFVRPDGTVIARLSHSDINGVDNWRATAQALQPPIEIQTILHDVDYTCTILVARLSRKTTEIGKCQMITHSKEPVGWVRHLSSRLGAMYSGFSTATMASRGDASAGHVEDTCLVVVDDDPDQPILSDPSCFAIVTSLLDQSAHIIWLSPDHPMPMHQITGVARSAHAENEKLRVTTIHVAMEQLCGERLQRLVGDCVQSMIAIMGGHGRDASREREYWLRKDGAICIPRLIPSQELNQAVMTSSEGDAATDDECTHNGSTDSPLAVDEIELATEACAVSKHGLAEGLFSYTGVVLKTGSAIEDVVPGDRVAAVSSVMPPASRLRVSRAATGHVSSDMPTAQCSALLDLMAAFYALENLAGLTSDATVLIDGPESLLRRAFLAAATSAGIRILETPSQNTEATNVIKRNVLLYDHHLAPSRQPRGHVRLGELDAVILTGDISSTAESALSQLNPFGCVIVMAPAARIRDSHLSNLPFNAALYRCHGIQMLRLRPEKVRVLMKQATGALRHVRLDGLDLCPRRFRQAAEALRMVESGVIPRALLVVPDPAPLAPDGYCGKPHRWTREDASYVVAGGLGDLGKRLLALMARRGAKHLVTLSRSLPKQEDRESLEKQLATINPKCHLYCIACDLTSQNSVQGAVEDLNRRGVPPVQGIIHSAAILQDRPLSYMTYDDFHAASQVKVQGTLALAHMLGSPRLAFFIMLSSAANIIGTSSQANYNAGNGVQDAFAHARLLGDDCHCISLNIGWIEDAIHTARNDARLAGLARAGLRAIRPDELERFFDCVLGSVYSTEHGRRLPVQAIVGFDSDSLSRATAKNGNVTSPMFCHVRPKTLHPSQSESVPSVASFQQMLATGDEGAIIDFVNAAIREQLAKLMSIDPSRLHIDRSSMLELGLDSLVAIELRNWLTRSFDCVLQPSEILDSQTIRALGKLVSLRSRMCHEKEKEDGITTELNGVKQITETPSQSLPLPRLPIPDLRDALRLFEESRRAIDSTHEQKVTAKQVQDFLQGSGPLLQQKVEASRDYYILNGYERQIYLQQRQPLQDYSEFTVIHTVDAPIHSQTLRAAIMTAAAAGFARGLLAGEILGDSFNGLPVNDNARGWMFWATRHPGANVDRMERYAPSQSVVLLRRGHVFELSLPNPGTPVQVSLVQAALEKIMNLSEETAPYVCALTAADRRSWFEARRELESDTDNAATLAAIDSAMFVVNLDDESPTSPGERHTHFLIGSQQQPFANRWLDKPIQFAVTANGFSGGIHEHTKMDAMDVRTLHQHINRALFSYDGRGVVDSGDQAIGYTVRQHVWRSSPTILQRIDHVLMQCVSGYGYIEHHLARDAQLGRRRCRSCGVPPRAVAHLVALLAVYLVDDKIRPAWEIVSLANYADGRLEWVQTVSHTVRSFLEAAAGLADAGPDGIGEESRHSLGRQFLAASRDYAETMTASSRGHGYVRHLHALCAAAELASSDLGTPMPELFRGQAWSATRRGGVDQDLKIGFMPDEGSDHLNSWEEGGFWMHGDKGIYIHCSLHEHDITLAISARPVYAEAVHKSLSKASSIVSRILG